jgi:RimJ/RimL family protein N-acetyltransferase
MADLLEQPGSGCSPQTHPGYGFVDESTPELGIAVSPEVRGRGIGRALLASLIEHARAAQLPALSLSVESDNPALRLYERLGFEKVGRVENAWTIRLDLRSLR